jgi:hypothetical protein
MHCLVAEVLKLSELEVDGEKVRCRPNTVALVHGKHFFDAVESRVHIQEINDHILRLFEVSVDHRYLQIDQEAERDELDVTHPTDLVKRRHYVLRITTCAINHDHFIPYSLHVVTGAEKLAKTLACHAELLLYATLEPYVD